MSIAEAIAVVAAAGLFLYLLYALLRGERL